MDENSDEEAGMNPEKLADNFAQVTIQDKVNILIVMFFCTIL